MYGPCLQVTSQVAWGLGGALTSAAASRRVISFHVYDKPMAKLLTFLFVIRRSHTSDRWSNSPRVTQLGNGGVPGPVICLVSLHTPLPRPRGLYQPNVLIGPHQQPPPKTTTSRVWGASHSEKDSACVFQPHLGG